MKHTRYIRNFALLGLGAAGLAMLIPSPDAAIDAEAQAPRFSLATSKELSDYLEARLRPPSPLTPPPIEVGLDNEAGSAPLAVDAASVVTPVAAGAALEGEARATVEPTAPAVATAIDVAEFDTRSSTALNVRSGPGTSSARLFVLKPGTAVRIERTKGNWAEIATAHGETGWAYAPFLATVNSQLESGSAGLGLTPDGYPPEESAKVAAPVDSSSPVGDEGNPKPKATKAKAFLLASNTVMRSSPSKGASKVTVIPGGSKLLVSGWDGSWARVILADGSSGWINVR